MNLILLECDWYGIQLQVAGEHASVLQQGISYHITASEKYCIRR